MWYQKMVFNLASGGREGVKDSTLLTYSTGTQHRDVAFVEPPGEGTVRPTTVQYHGNKCMPCMHGMDLIPTTMIARYRFPVFPPVISRYGYM